MKIKNALLNTLGIISLGLAFGIIYVLIYTTGSIRVLSTSVLIEFAIVAVLIIYSRTFWYQSVENMVRTSPDNSKTENKVRDAISNEVTDINHFDGFIDTQNLRNYNTYMMNKCRNLTVRNYRLTLNDKLIRYFAKHFNKHVYTENAMNDKYFYFKRYILKVENKALHIHKLSSSSVMTLSNSPFIDDRNRSTKTKLSYIIFGAISSIAFALLCAIISFNTKQDIDKHAAVLKMFIYSATMVFNIILTIITAYIQTKKNDIEYFGRIVEIIERYHAYKTTPTVITELKYLKEEDSNDITNTANKETIIVNDKS